MLMRLLSFLPYPSHFLPALPGRDGMKLKWCFYNIVSFTKLLTSVFFGFFPCRKILRQFIFVFSYRKHCNKSIFPYTI